MRTTRTLILSLLFVSACGETVSGNGDIVTETFELDAFARAQNHTFSRLSVESGDSSELVVTCDSNLLDQLDIQVVDGALEVRLSNPFNDFDNTDSCTGVVTTPTLTSVLLDDQGGLEVVDSFDGLAEARQDGAGPLTLAGMSGTSVAIIVDGGGPVTIGSVIADDIDIESTGPGALTATGIEAATVKVMQDAAGSVDLDGDATSVDVTKEGRGTIDASGLEAEDVTIDFQGASEVSVFASVSATGTLKGKGRIIVYGGGDVDITVDGQGTVEEL